MRAELGKLSSEAIANVYLALHELTSNLRELARDILWERHATPGGVWPLRVAIVGNPHSKKFDMTARCPEHELVGYCAAGKMPSEPTLHHDDEHVVRRTLEFEAAGHDFHGIECSCGRRSDKPPGDRRLDIMWYRLRPDASVWPKVSDRAHNNGLPCYQVCRDAPTADHRGHAPNSTGERCLCGVRLGAYHDMGKDKFLPVQ